MSAAVSVDSSHMTPSSFAPWCRFSPPSNFVKGHVSTVWLAVCRWPQSQEGDWARPHLCKLARHGPWPVRKRFIGDHVSCMTREIETWLSDSRVGNNSVVDHRSRRPVLSPLCNCIDRYCVGFMHHAIFVCCCANFWLDCNCIVKFWVCLWIQAGFPVEAGGPIISTNRSKMLLIEDVHVPICL